MPSIEKIIADGEESIYKLITSVDNYLGDNFMGNDNPASFKAEYEGERKRRSTSLDMIQRPKTIGSKEDNTEKTVFPNKYRFNFPKKIVRFATAMLFGGNMIIEADDKDEKFEDFKRLWSTKLKMQSRLKELCRRVKIETRGAILFYSVEAKANNIKGFNYSPENTIKSKIIDSTCGQFAPHFDEYDDMDAFLWRHKEEIDDELEEVFDIYTETERIRYIKSKEGWDEPEIIKHNFSVIPVVFAQQRFPEWEEIGSLMDGYEVRVSKLGDANDYTGDPLLIVQGDAELPKKHQVGKVLKFEAVENDNGTPAFGDAKYLTHDQLPASNKLEMDTLKEGIHSGTSTPDLSFEQVKGLGTLSGVAIEMLFMDSILKTKDDREIFDPVVSRCVSVVKNGMESFMKISGYKGIDETDITVRFNSPIPRNEDEYISMLGDSVTNNILSKKTAVEKHPEVKDAEEEYKLIQQEQKEENSLLNSGQNGETWQ